MNVGIGGNPYAGNRHADILSEDPKDEAGKMRLLEEVKNRAKGAFQQKDMPSAELLYSKAIDILDTMPDKKEHTLYSNRSMVRLNLSKVDEALADAKACLALEPTFAKAWHRKAQALVRLSEWDDAIEAAKEGLKVEPSNKAFPELIEKAEADKAKDLVDKSRLKRDAQDVKVELHNASTSRQANKPKPKDGEDVDESMKGYKTRADGARTSYFHTDISDEAKRLIKEQGYGEPKKLDVVAADGADVAGGGSQWNQAGTYEEKGMMKWVEEKLQSALTGLTFEKPEAKLKLTTTGIDALKGDASISVSRGKRRRLLDVGFEVNFEGEVGEAKGKAKFVFSEVTAGDDDEPDWKVEGATDTPPGVVAAFKLPAGAGLHPLIMKELQRVLEDYKTQ